MDRQWSETGEMGPKEWRIRRLIKEMEGRYILATNYYLRGRKTSASCLLHFGYEIDCKAPWEPEWRSLDLKVE